MKRLLAIARVVVTAAPAWLAAATLAAPIIAEEAAKVLPAPWSERVTALALTVVGVAGAALAVIRRVAPVLPSQRGLLPPEGSS